jgi:uncharacterized membrane protein YheB (UPF0754 family)
MIGWITNYVAIKMLFKPYNKINFGFFSIQGLIPKRRHEIGQKIAATVKESIISMTDILNSLNKKGLEEELEVIVDKLIHGKVKPEILNAFPMAAMFLTESVILKVELGIKKIILENKESIIEGILNAVEKNVNFEEIIIKNIDNFSLEELEKITLNLARTELRHIEIIGAILGGIIGIAQIGINLFM